jgi:hypothetical protein
MNTQGLLAWCRPFTNPSHVKWHHQCSCRNETRGWRDGQIRWRKVCVRFMQVVHITLINKPLSLIIFPWSGHTYVTPSSRALLEKPPVATILQILPALHGIRRLITMFNRPLLSERQIQTIPFNHIALRYILILSTQLHLVVWTISFRFSRQDYLRVSLHPNPYHMPTNLILLTLITLIISGETWK